MDDAPVGGRHRLQCYGPIALNHPGGNFSGHVPQGGFPPLAVTLYVQDDPGAVAVLIANNQVDDELQGLQGLASASDQKA